MSDDDGCWDMIRDVAICSLILVVFLAALFAAKDLWGVG